MKLTTNDLLETWRIIPGFENYEVSNLGNVRKIDGKVMKQFPLSNGYMKTLLRANGVRKNVLIHRLVMSAFVGACPDGKQVNHIDENRANNMLSNLEYVTPSENIRHGNCLKKISAAHSIPVIQYSLDGEKIAEFPSITCAAKKVHAHKNSICNCCRGKYKTAAGYKWGYAERGDNEINNK